MARWTHRDKGILSTAAHDFIDRHRCAPHAMRDGHEAFRAHDRVGVEIDSSLLLGRGLDGIGIVRRVHTQDGGAIDAGGVHPAQLGETRVIESPGDGADAIRTFRMTRSGIVIETSGVAQQKRRHNQETRGVCLPAVSLMALEGFYPFGRTSRAQPEFSGPSAKTTL